MNEVDFYGEKQGYWEEKVGRYFITKGFYKDNDKIGRWYWYYINTGDLAEISTDEYMVTFGNENGFYFKKNFSIYLYHVEENYYE